MYEFTDDGTDITTRQYYSVEGMMVAMKEWVNEGSRTTHYFASDHLSSTSLVMDENGALLSENRYMPFGEVRTISGTTSITETDFGYTGQRDYSGDFGLMDYNARFYSPTLGRFTQPDTIVPEPGSSQAWNRYSYTLNNPVKYNDPSGHVLNILAGAGIGAAIGGGAYLLNHFISGGDCDNINGKELLVAAGVGAAGGALIASGAALIVAAAGTTTGVSGGAIAGTALVGAGQGALASEVGYTMAAGEDYQTNEMLVSAGVGAAAGAASAVVSSPLVGLGAAEQAVANTVIGGAAGGVEYGLQQEVNGESGDPEGYAYAIKNGMEFGFAGEILGGSAPDASKTYFTKLPYVSPDFAMYKRGEYVSKLVPNAFGWGSNLGRSYFLSAWENESLEKSLESK